MKIDRRDLFMCMPAGLAGLAFLAEPANSQTAAGLRADPAAVDFWTRKMGVPADHLSQPGEKRVYGPIGTSGLTVDQQEADLEPFFFYFDDESNDPQTVLLPADRLTAEHLDANHDRGPDTKVTFTKKRVRFGETDRKVYEKYASCGLYLETQQHPDAPSNNYGQMAWSLLSAVLPAVPLPTPKQTKGGSGGKNAAQDSSKVPAASTTASVAQADPSPKGATPLSSSVPPPTQTVLLPSGIGQSAFACFLKDRQQSRFAQFINLLIPPGSLAQPFAPLLTMPAIGSAALSAVRALVGSMATHPAGDKTGDQLTLFQQAPRQIVAARESALANSNRVLKIRTGTYLLVPKRQADQIPNAADYIISDGWLVSKDIRKNTQMATAASKETMKPISYMTIEVKVERTSLGCSNIKKG